MNQQTVMIIQYLAVAVLFFEFLYVSAQKPSDLQRDSLVIVITTILMFVGYNIELTSSNLDEALAGTIISYIGKPYIMLGSLKFILDFYQVKINKGFFLGLCTYCGSFCVIVSGNYRHHLYYATEAFDPDQPYSPLVLTRGPLYYLYVVTAVAFFFGCIAITIFGSRKIKDKATLRKSYYIVAMIIFGIGGYAVYLSRLSNGYDYTMMGVFLGVLCLLMLFIRCKIFDAASYGKDLALDDSLTGIQVYGITDELAYSNKIMEYYLSDNITSKMLHELPEGETTLEDKDRIISIKVRNLTAKNAHIGKTIEVNDITNAYNYQAKLERDVKARTEDLENIKKDLIVSVANIIEARSVETGTHIKRTSGYSALIARTLFEKGLYKEVVDENFVDLIESATPLHDVGKISIPDVILSKPTRLTEAEFEIMKTHAQNGGNIIEKTMTGIESDEFVKMASDIARYHHEWWNGKGYTEHLKGEEIPLSARIVAIADFYDAMTSDRVYRKALSSEEVLNMIKNESGTHFDPMLVYAFEDALKKQPAKN